MEADQTRHHLLEQHGRIRAHLGRCAEVAHELATGEPVSGRFEAELSELRGEFADHNKVESVLVRSFLSSSSNWGVALVDRMMEEHAAEHAVFWDTLHGSAFEVAGRMNDIVEELEAHMAAEERTFLNPTVLHERAIARHQ